MYVQYKHKGHPFDTLIFHVKPSCFSGKYYTIIDGTFRDVSIYKDYCENVEIINLDPPNIPLGNISIDMRDMKVDLASINIMVNKIQGDHGETLFKIQRILEAILEKLK